MVCGNQVGEQSSPVEITLKGMTLCYHDNCLPIGQRVYRGTVCYVHVLYWHSYYQCLITPCYLQLSVVPDVPHVLDILPVYSLDGAALAAKIMITNNLTVSNIFFLRVYIFS